MASQEAASPHGQGVCQDFFSMGIRLTKMLLTGGFVR